MFEHATYLLLLVAWLAPVLAIQWHAGARILRARWRVVVLATCLPTAYLAAADRYALGTGIWQISAERTTGIRLAGLPLEELLFFLLTNLVIVQAVVLFLAPELTPAFARAQAARHLRRLRRALTPVQWCHGLLATAGAALAATVAVLLTHAAPHAERPAAALTVPAPAADNLWAAILPGPYSEPLAAVVVYLALGTLAGWLARGNCLIARTLTVLVGASIYCPLAEPLSPPVGAILAVGPLLPGVLQQALRKRSVSL